MDWDNIEREFEKHTQNHLNAGSKISGIAKFYAVRDENLNNSVANELPLPPQTSKMSALTVLRDDVGPSRAISREPEYIHREIETLRTANKQQINRIETLERLILGQSKTSSFVQSDLQNRIFALENEQKQIVNTSMRNSDTLNGVASRAVREYDDMIFTRLTALEEAAVKSTNVEDQTENLRNIIATIIDHVYAISSVAETARETSLRSAGFVEVFLKSLFSLDSATTQTSLEFLTNLTALDESHRDLITRLLTDLLHTVITSSIKSQMSTVIECLGDIFTPQIERVNSKHDALQTDLMSKMHTVSTKADNSFTRVEERTTRLQMSQDLISADVKGLAEAARQNYCDREEVAVLRETVAALSTKVNQIVQSPQNSNKDLRDNVLERLHSLQLTVDALQATQQTLQTSSDDAIFDLTNSIEKLRSLDMSTKAQVESLSASTKEEVAGMKQANQKMQLVLEQQTGELYKRFSKLETKADKKDKSAGGAVSEDALKSVVSEMDALRQSLANVIFDVDDVKSQLRQFQERVEKAQQAHEKGVQKSMETAIEERDLISRKVSLFESTLKNLQSGMDALQEEIVALSSVTSPTAVKSDALSAFDSEDRKGLTTDYLSQEITAEENALMENPSVPKDDCGINEAPTAEQESGVATVDESEKSDGSKKDGYTISAIRFSPERATSSVVERAESTSESPANSSQCSSDSEDERLSGSSSSASFQSESSRSEGDFRERDDSDEEADILGKSPPRPGKVAGPAHPSHARAPIPDAPERTPSEVLAEQLRLRAVYEREQALKNVTAKRLSSSITSQGVLAGPPLGAVEALSDAGSIQRAQTNALSPKPVLSGSLLSGRRLTNNASSLGPGPRISGSGKPIFDPSFGSAESTEKDRQETNSNGSSRDASKQTVFAGMMSDKRDTVQCTHCLRRVSRIEIVHHNATCELRTELCPNGCGAKVRAIKLEAHLKECPKR